LCCLGPGTSSIDQFDLSVPIHRTTNLKCTADAPKNDSPRDVQSTFPAEGVGSVPGQLTDSCSECLIATNSMSGVDGERSIVTVTNAMSEVDGELSITQFTNRMSKVSAESSMTAVTSAMSAISPQSTMGGLQVQ